MHPNDDVNDPFSSNDQFPAAIHIAATRAIATDLIPALRPPRRRARGQGRASSPAVVKSGRTHLMDATPVTLGQEFGGYAAQVRYGVERLHGALPRVGELPLGGTAVGTGINAPAGLAAEVIALLADDRGLPLTEARDHFEAQGSRDAPGRGQRRAAHDRGRPEQDQQRHPLDGLGPAHRPDRDLPARPAAGQRRSCPAR